VEETETWKDDLTLPGKSKEGYNPLIDRGRWRCRHSIRYIPKELACDMRPDLCEAMDTQVNELMQNAINSSGEVDMMTNEYAQNFGGLRTPVNLKSKESIVRKVNDELNGDVSKLKDSVRTTVIIEENKLNDVYNTILKDPRFESVKLQTPDKYLGYSGVLANFKTEQGIYAEIQVNSAKIIYAKEEAKAAKSILGDDLWTQMDKKYKGIGGHGHEYYDEYRKLNPIKNAIERDEIERISKEYYDTFR
jgi:hypothetical protein